MMTWPYLCDETSSKTTVTNCLKKCHHCTQIWHMGSYSRCNHSNLSHARMHSNHSLTHHLHLAQKYKVPFARFARFRGLIKILGKSIVISPFDLKLLLLMVFYTPQKHQSNYKRKPTSQIPGST